MNGGKREQKFQQRKKNTRALDKNIRLRRSQLKKALDLNEREYSCRTCGISQWRGKNLKLHIHHIDHDKTNNSVENLEYLCPNCHGIEHHEEKA